MPFEIIHTDGMVTIHLTGRITGADIVSAAQAVIDHPDFESGRPRVWDACGVAQVLLNIEQARQLRALLEDRPRQRCRRSGRTAIVVAREIDWDVAEFLRWYLRGRRIQVFGSLDEAKAWVLGG